MKSTFIFPLLPILLHIAAFAGNANAHPISVSVSSDTTNITHHPHHHYHHHHHHHQQQQQHHETLNSTMLIGENKIECTICSYVASGLNSTIFNNPKILAKVTSEIQKMCDAVPPKEQPECINAATNIAPYVLQQVGDFIAEEGCVDLGICPAN
jgi:hypothetical protein